VVAIKLEIAALRWPLFDVSYKVDNMRNSWKYTISASLSRRLKTITDLSRKRRRVLWWLCKRPDYVRWAGDIFKQHGRAS